MTTHIVFDKYALFWFPDAEDLNVGMVLLSGNSDGPVHLLAHLEQDDQWCYTMTYKDQTQEFANQYLALRWAERMFAADVSDTATQLRSLIAEA